MRNNQLLDNRSPKWVAALLPWIQWLHIYDFFAGLTLGYVFIIIVDLYYLFHLVKIRMFSVNRNNLFLLIFAIYCVLASSIALLAEEDVVLFLMLKRVTQMTLLYAAIVFTSTDDFDWKTYKKSLAILTFIACAALLIQVLMRTFTGQYYNFKLPFLKYSTSEANERLIGSATTGSRYRSIFTEPSHFVYFTFQYLVVVMFGEKGRDIKSVFTMALISFCVLLSASSTGLILLIMVWTVYMVLFYKGRKLTVSSFLLGLMILAMLAFSIYIYMGNENLSQSFTRMTGDYERSNTVWKRLYANLEDVQNLKGLSLLFGHGLGNVRDEFMNSIVYMLLNVGYIGLFIVFLWLVSWFKKSSLCGKMAIVVLITLSAIDLVLFTPTVWAYIMIAAHSPIIKRGERNNEFVQRKGINATEYRT